MQATESTREIALDRGPPSPEVCPPGEEEVRVSRAASHRVPGHGRKTGRRRMDCDAARGVVRFNDAQIEVIHRRAAGASGRAIGSREGLARFRAPARAVVLECAVASGDGGACRTMFTIRAGGHLSRRTCAGQPACRLLRAWCAPSNEAEAAEPAVGSSVRALAGDRR